jgi:hypothetical protein
VESGLSRIPETLSSGLLIGGQIRMHEQLRFSETHVERIPNCPDRLNRSVPTGHEQLGSSLRARASQMTSNSDGERVIHGVSFARPATQIGSYAL